MFIQLVHELAEQVPLGKLFRIDGTDIQADHRDDDAQWNYDHAEDDFYYGYGYCVVTAANNIPVAASFTPAKKVSEETAMRVTPDALAVKTPRWFLDDSEFDMLEWHDWLSHVFIALCLRLATALANHHRGNDVADPTITL